MLKIVTLTEETSGLPILSSEIASPEMAANNKHIPEMCVMLKIVTLMASGLDKRIDFFLPKLYLVKKYQ